MTCGACCTSPSARHVPVTGDDWGRLGDDADALTEWTQSHAFMRMNEGRCIALALEAGGGARCTIYARRPEVCRALERGGPACDVERLRKLPIVR
jgi:Fe-S-cluster containining protein